MNSRDINTTTNEYWDLLFPYAYNILGATEDAKDAIHDVMIKYLSSEKKELADEKNYLIRSVINRAINLKSKNKRTLRTGEHWLPEPIATDDSADKRVYLNDVLSYSLLVLMEKLNARERAVFILKETFDYSHLEIADILHITEEHSRKLLSRAKANLFKPPHQRSVREMAHEKEIVVKFMNAIRQRDTRQLESAMASDIVFYADGGGKAPLLTGTGHGSREVAELLVTAYTRFLESATIIYAQINHQPALLSFIKGKLTSCQVLDLDLKTGAVLQINAVLDPAKLVALHDQLFMGLGPYLTIRP